jgi:nitrilase
MDTMEMSVENTRAGKEDQEGPMSNAHPAPFMVAVAQVAPVFLDRSATLEKACELIVDAGQAGARLIVFPAAFIPGYPVWIWNIPPGEKSLLNELYGQLLANAVSIPSESTDRLCRIAQRARINIVMGMSERDTESTGTTCYNTLLYINAHGHIVGKHRSLLLTGAERLVWAQGDGSTLQVHKLPLATISGLIGGEHYLPLARYALYAWGTQLYIAAATDASEPWLSTLRHIAREGRVFVIGCGMALHTTDIADSYSFKQRFSVEGEAWIHPGDSVVVNPNGEFIVGPVRAREEALYAQIDPQQVSGPRWMLDVTGHDARPDIFHLTIRREPHTIIQAGEIAH